VPAELFSILSTLMKHIFSFHMIVWQCIVDNLDTFCICIENFLPQSCESRPTFAGIRSNVSCVMLFYGTLYVDALLIVQSASKTATNGLHNERHQADRKPRELQR